MKTLIHNFKDAPGARSLFDGTTSLAEFIKKLDVLCKELPLALPIQYGRSGNLKKDENKILGDGFELFVEILIHELGASGHILLRDYVPFGQDEGEEDQGIDGFAVNNDNKKVGVQCKFVNNATYKFTANESNLPNFLVECALEGIFAKGQMYLFTTADGINWQTAKKWRHILDDYTFCRSKIAELVDNNRIFWPNAVKYFD